MVNSNTSQYNSAGDRGAGAAFVEVREAAAGLVAEGRGQEAFDYLLAALAAVLKKSRELELLVAKLRRERLGTRSERVDPKQLALLLEELAEQLGTEAEALDPAVEARADAELEAEIERERAARRADGKGKRSRASAWRGAGVKREVHRVEVGEDERRCEHCGGEKRKIGADVSRVLEYVPAHFVEHEYHRDKWACARCKCGVTTAAAPEKVILRGAADASLLAHVVVSKYGDHCPLHRLRRMYERSGAAIAVSTLADWVAEVALLLEPLVERLAARVLRDAYVVRTDATGLKVLDPGSPDNIERGTMWVYVGDDRDVVFRYTPTGEGASGPWAFLAGRSGYIQADAASVFDRLYDGQVASAVEVGCWAHGRRRFVAIEDTDCRVAYPLMLIARLYRIERLADVRELSPDERCALRHERTGAVLDTLKRWLGRSLGSEPPSSEFAAAARYVLNQWTALTRFLDDGRLGLDNNLCERQLRDIALGRKNYLFAGSHEAAHRAATLYSVLRTSAQHGVPPLPYLTDVLRKLAAGWPHDRLDELLPDRWQTNLAPQQLQPFSRSTA